MTQVFKLAVAFLCEHPIRLVLTTLGTAAAICMVVWTASGYEALHRTYDEYANLALGRYELAIAPISMDAKDSVPDEVITDLSNDPAVAIADPMWAKRLGIRTRSRSEEGKLSSFSPNQDRQSLTGSGPGAGPNSLLPELLFLAVKTKEPPYDMQQGRWLNTEVGNANDVVIRADVAERRGLSLNDEIRVEVAQGNLLSDDGLKLRIVGIVNAPSLPGAGVAAIPILSPSSGEAFISTTLANKLFDEPERISLLGISLAPEADLTSFRFGWSPKLSRYSTPVQFQEAFEIEEALDQAAAARNVRLQSYVATAIAMLVAMLVIFCTLSTGGTERTRQYAILRAITLTRRQVATLIAIEGLCLGVLGFLGGILVGWLLLQVTGAVFARLLYHGVAFGKSSLILSAVAAFGGGLLAAIIPAWRATRVRPIDAMTPPQQSTEGKKASAKLALIGLVFIALNPILTFGIPQTEASIYLAMGIGFACMSVGVVLLAPAIVEFVDRCVSPVLARLFALDPKLLASQITSHLWRTVGAAISMAFGLGLFIGIQVWGFTMLQAFVPGEWTPDAIIAFEEGFANGNVSQDVSQIADLPGVDLNRCLALAVEQPRLLEDITGSTERASVTRQDNVIIVGLDPQSAFGAESPLLELDWVAGTPQEAINQMLSGKQMQSGRACVVPDHFLNETGLTLGDSITLVPPENSEQPVSYKIAGAVRLPGWHWQTKLTGMRPRTHRAAALIFSDYQSVSTDFDIPNPTHVWFSFAETEADSKAVLEAVETGLAELQTDESAHAQPASENLGFRVITVQGIRDHLSGIARRWIWLISTLPLIALLIASLGVLNVLIASIRSRRWEFGVLRAIGFTSSELARAILVEGLLISCVAGLLSLGFGILAGWCGCGMAQYVSFFGGLHPPVVIPWFPITIGMIFLLALGIGVAIWPAFTISRTRPLELLQRGPDSL
ncbi:ABC transporter permease [Thalassoglobus polymorphus]|uniref:Macrolide export ATP-binding/permease protein MacB n=1 Tax=Thalassoglobus polymorphus TaxID=2527994 RepID=A0A517QNA4_9PLAN|nr:FtsX-like permease family protein [Thalassoglobus polymorphus]QDT33116.1 Macrolide export ATP-binding/permease protein MacB [Thalassoglobus polymorphus]